MRALNAGRAAIMAGLMLAAALASAPLARAAETIIRFSLDFRIEGPSAMFLLPLDKGYYKAEDVNVTVDPAASSVETINRVATGVYDIGFADINALIKFRDANPTTAPRSVFMVYNKPPYAIIARKSRGISKPKDLEGKKLGGPAADDAFAAWPIFVQASGIDASKVTIENVGLPVREPMLAAGQVDAITGISFSSFINLKDKGVPIDDFEVLLMADDGVELYGSAIIVNPKFAADHADAVRGFLRAFLKGLKETVKAPSAAIDSALKRNDSARKSSELERLTMAIHDNIVTPEVKDKGYGGVDRDRFAKAIDQIGQTYKWKSTKPKIEDVFDASFLPSEADRKFQ